MSAQYGWLKVNGNVSHPLAEMHNGHIYVHKKDMATGQCLVAGDAVTFYLYADDKGLGAEACKGEGTTNHAAVMQMHANYSSWSSHAVKPQHQYSAFAAPFVPSLQTCKAEPLEDSDYSADGVLPSLGSVGHSDGSCKRCAFFPKGRCQNGENCEHCHFDHVGRKRLRTRKPRSQEKCTEEPVLPDGEFLPTKEIEEEHSEDDELLDVQEAGAAKQQQSKENDDSHSENGSVDLATVAPSSSYPSDDEGSPKHSPLEMSDTESCSSHPDAMWPLDFHQELATFIQKHSIVAQTMTSSRRPQEVSARCALPTVQDFGFSHVDDDDCASSAGTDTSGEQSPSSSTSVDLSPISWSSQQRSRRAGESDLGKDLSPAEITRKARALLNKLTHDRFESLCSQILALPLSTPEQLAALAAEIFEKATTQDGFRSLYTELCLRLDAHFGEQSSVIGGKTFRKVLVNECQATFDRNLQPADAALFEDLTAEESFELEMKLKTRRLGNMRFIGELIVQRLLAQKLMTPIMLELLNGDEVALESLIAFLTIVAPCFDQKASLHHAQLQDVFATLQRKKNDKQLSSRLHCHLSDLFDSRARGWAVRSA